MSRREVRELLASGLHPRLERLEASGLEGLAAGLQGWRRGAGEGAPEDHPSALRQVCFYLIQALNDELEEVASLRRDFAEHTRRHAHAVTERERRAHLLDFAHRLGAGWWQLAGDRWAFARWLGEDALVDRFRRRVGEREHRVALALDRLGVLGARYLAESADGPVAAFRGLRLERRLAAALEYTADHRVRSAAFRCLSAILRALPDSHREGTVSESTLRRIYRAALDPRQDVWIQCDALELLQYLSEGSFRVALERRAGNPREGDDLFVRRRVARLLGENLASHPELEGLLPELLGDPSPYVRQGLAAAVVSAPPRRALTWLRRQVETDELPQVRAAASEQMSRLAAQDEVLDGLRETLAGRLADEADPFVLRVTLKVIGDIHRSLLGRGADGHARAWRMALLPPLGALHHSAASLPVRRWAAELRERLWCEAEPARETLRADLAGRLSRVPPGSARRLPRTGAGEATVGRVLSVLAQDDYDYALQRRRRGYRAARGHRFRFRTWRLLHELRHASPDKRQAYGHTRGRVFYGGLHAPSARMAELSETRVPGEPLYLEEEGGSRPYLPLVDEAISCLDEGLRATPLRIYTSEGVTELRPPRSLAARLAARASLTLRFAHYARLRNWREQDRTPPGAYLQALRELGLEVEYRPHAPGPEEPAWSADPSVQRFFALALPWDPGLWRRLQEYFFSVYQNTIHELAVFLIAISALFVGRHLVLNAQIRAARRRLPLVIGGWGTRGKSGTERIKAALFNALGYSVVAKTTGTEAMFLHCHRHGPLGEMFLFRPYDKATIWEQAKVVRLAAALRADVFLWECMALNPTFVRILQRDWMRDDIATITNTYPDHEDLQGPAGIDIPQVMTRFIPRRARLLISEEQMAPILRDAARRLHTPVQEVGWLEAGLLTDDVLGRFPYQEHPYNIALVLAMAEELGIERDFALKEMADYVLPDLGVLQTFPPAPILGRRLEFTNGMAANERLGFLGNWRRMGFAAHDPERDPGVWITTVVNNRADRVARSRVFAEILVGDVSADRHFLIGTNLQGLLGYLREVWQARTPEPADPEAARELLERQARQLRVPTAAGQVQARLRAMLEGLGIDGGPLPEARDAEAVRARLEGAGQGERAEEVLGVARGLSAELGEYQRLAQRLRSGEAFAELRELLWSWWLRRLVVIPDPHASGEAIIEQIARATPPGFLNRVMGCQNIKGTGLDFVYRWQAWGACHSAGERLRADDREAAESGLRALASAPSLGLLCREHLAGVLEEVRHTPLAQNELFQAQIRRLLARLAEEAAARPRQSAPRSGFLVRVAAGIEAFLDAGDAVRRRRHADRVYRDLVHERISHECAIYELRSLNKRQKGGWLIGLLHGAMDGLRRSRPGQGDAALRN